MKGGGNVFSGNRIMPESEIQEYIYIKVTLLTNYHDVFINYELSNTRWSQATYNFRDFKVEIVNSDASGDVYVFANNGFLLNNIQLSIDLKREEMDEIQIGRYYHEYIEEYKVLQMEKWKLEAIRFFINNQVINFNPDNINVIEPHNVSNAVMSLDNDYNENYPVASNVTPRRRGGKKNKTRKNTNKTIYFKDHPDFTPNLTPIQIFRLGSFGGTYWRPIYSKTNKRNYKNVHKKYPKSWWKNIPEENLSSSEYDINKNKYKVKVGLSLEYWENKKWIHPDNPYGWVHWYCDFYNGKRGEDDRRQIERWKGLAGPKGRFMRFLVTKILNKGAKYNDISVSPKIRQVLQHWGYVLSKKDFNNELIRRKNNSS